MVRQQLLVCRAPAGTALASPPHEGSEEPAEAEDLPVLLW